MTVVRFDPFRHMEKMQRRMQGVLNDTGRAAMNYIGSFNPRIDITEDDKALYFYVELPGIVKEEVKVSVNEERLLTIKGEKKRQEPGEGKQVVRNERIYGSFERTFALPENSDYDKISAKYENGVLELTLPKIEPPKPKEIEININ